MRKDSKIVLIFALLVVSAFTQPGRPTPVPPTPAPGGGNQNSNCCPSDRTISVTGTATVSVAPNFATLTIYLSETNTTSALAISQLNTKASAIQSILQRNGISAADIKTTYISIYPQTNYVNGTSVITGATASQSITVTVRSLGVNNANLAKIFDALSSVPGISIYNSGFDNSDKTAALQTAYAQAYADARRKADLLAKLSGATIVGVKDITDNTYLYGTDVTVNLRVTYLISNSATSP